jgi:hypothetical protein
MANIFSAINYHRKLPVSSYIRFTRFNKLTETKFDPFLIITVTPLCRHLWTSLRIWGARKEAGHGCTQEGSKRYAETPQISWQTSTKIIQNREKHVHRQRTGWLRAMKSAMLPEQQSWIDLHWVDISSPSGRQVNDLNVAMCRSMSQYDPGISRVSWEKWLLHTWHRARMPRGSPAQWRDASRSR